MEYVTVYDLCYSQNNGRNDAGPSIGTLWDRRRAEAIAARSSDLTVVARDIPESLALEIAE